MKLSSLSKIIVVIAFFAGVLGTGSYFLFSQQLNSNKTISTPVADKQFGWRFPISKFPLTGSSNSLIAYSDIRDPGGIPQGLPVRLKIPLIGVDSAIEDALITPDGRMDVPVGSVHVAWFALGPHPGQAGSAVIGGHFGIDNGVPFVFYDLDKLKIGDKIYVVNDKDETIAFIVRSVKSFDRNADATPVFTSDDGLAHLNLITCEGIWNQVNNSYPQRLVVFTDAVPVDTPVNSAAIFTRLLRIGSRGKDVVALQTILTQKGFLKIPSTTARGYFGSRTRTALAKYQQSNGLPSSGIFDTLTKAKLVPTFIALQPTSSQGSLVSEPIFPSTALAQFVPSPTSTPSFFQALVLYVRSLYATPVDILITTLLLLAIIITSIKIYKKMHGA